MRPYQVNIDRNGDTGTWFVEASDVPGLNVEAPTFEALVSLIEQTIPELLGECHGHPHGNIRYRLIYDTVFEATPQMPQP